jgi:signal transduction histidine kinase
MADLGRADIFGFVRDLSLARDLESITAVLRQRARGLVACDGLAVVLREGDRCHYVEEDAIGPLWKGRSFPMSACVSGWVIERGTPVVIRDIYADPRIPHELYRSTFVRSLVLVPIGAPEAVGAIGAYWAVEREASPDEVALLQGLADAAAMALANARLYEGLNLAASEARASNDAKDRLLAMVGHELRNPLAAIVTALELMRARPDRPRGERAREVVERQVRHMARLVDELLDLSRLARGAIQLAPELLEAQSIIDGGVEVAEPSMRDGTHTLIVDVRDGGALLHGDALRLQQVVTNLLINAARYTPDGGRIGLTARADGDHFHLSVKDNGVGLSADIAPRVFEPFVRGEAGRNVSGGVGVGLALVQQIVTLHGGTVEARSDGPNTGCEFIVRIPLAPANARPRHRETGVSSPREHRLQAPAAFEPHTPGNG